MKWRINPEGVALRAEPTNSVEAAAWRLRGASEDGIWIESERPFFALGTNPVRRVYASASGALSFGSARHPPVGAALPDSAARSESSPYLETGLAQRLGGDASPHLRRRSCPSGISGDYATVQSIHIPGLLWDYEPDELSTGHLTRNHSINGPSRLYPVIPPVRRQTP